MSLPKIIIIGLLIGCVNASFLSQTAASNDLSADRIVDLNEIAHIIEQIAVDGPGTTPDEQILLDKINELGPAAVPQLILLLDHQDKDVRAHASSTLGGNKHLTEEHLDVLMDFMSRGNWYLSPAIAKIGTPAAISFLVEELKKDKASRSILLYSISSLGEKAVPYLVELIKTKNDDKGLLRAVNSIFEKMGDKASSAVDPLIEIALHDNRDEVRKWAIYGLGSIGEPARRSAAILKELAEQNPQAFEDAVGGVLMAMKAPEATDYLVKDLEDHLSLYVFRRIAELGKSGISAGPELIQYLNHEDWEIRLGAARALGYIGYEAASHPLIGILDNTDDWRLVYVSAESLGRLQSKESIQALAQISKEHWYSPVRDAAKKAMEVIKGESTYESKSHFPSEFFAYQHIRLGSKKIPDNEDAEPLDVNVIIPEDTLSSSNLVNCSYIAYANVMNPKGHKQIPEVGIKVESGCLVGSARGEWGGELMFIDSCGNSTLVIKDNIKGIYRTPAGILVVAGLAHLTSNRGLVYKVSRDDAGNWSATKWKVLPGAPRSSALYKDDSLYIDCLGGQIVLMPDGTIEMNPRANQQR